MSPVTMYVVVSVFDPADGKARVTHAWGTYASRTAAVTARKRMQQEDEVNGQGRVGVLTYHTCEVLGEAPK